MIKFNFFFDRQERKPIKFLKLYHVMPTNAIFVVAQCGFSAQVEIKIGIQGFIQALSYSRLPAVETQSLIKFLTESSFWKKILTLKKCMFKNNINHSKK